MTIYLIIGVICGIIGFTWVAFLTQPDDLFGWLPSKIHELSTKLPNGTARVVKKITYECPRCISGQLALWTVITYDITHMDFNHVYGFVSIFISIFVAGWLDILWQRTM